MNAAQNLPVAIPVPTFRHHDGTLDELAIKQYARHLATTEIDHVIVAGPMGLGETCTPEERTRLLDLWVTHFDRELVVSACWQANDVQEALQRGVRPLVMLQADTDADLLSSLGKVPAGGIAYANPRYSKAVLTPELLTAARGQGVLPSAVKLSKVTGGEIAEMRAAAGRELQIIHGSSRDVAGSLAAGADAVVAPPLAALPLPWPEPTSEALQRAVDATQRLLDTCADHRARVAMISELAQRRIAAQDTPSDRHAQGGHVRKTA